MHPVWQVIMWINVAVAHTDPSLPQCPIGIMENGLIAPPPPGPHPILDRQDFDRVLDTRQIEESMQDTITDGHTPSQSSTISQQKSLFNQGHALIADNHV